MNCLAIISIVLRGNISCNRFALGWRKRVGRTQKNFGKLAHRLRRLWAKRHGAANARYPLLKLNVGHSDLLTVVDESRYAEVYQGRLERSPHQKDEFELRKSM